MWLWKNGQRRTIAGFEDRERESQAKECRQPLETGKGKETDSPQELQKTIHPYQHLDFSPLRPVPDFCPSEL